MKIKSILTALVLLSALSAQLSTAHAQGTAFTYNGLLQNNNVPCGGAFDFKFLLYTNLSGGSAVAGPFVTNGVTVNGGAFTVTIDFGAAVWDGQTNWLGIEVEGKGDASFTTLEPRQEITPTPYAIYAETAGNLSGKVGNSQLANSSITVTAGTGLTGGGTFPLGGMTTLSVAPGSVNNSMLANSSITVNTGPGLGGGQSVALGGMITLNNTGVTSLTGGDGVTVSAATGGLTLGLGSTLTLLGLPVSINAGNNSVFNGGNSLLYADNNGNYFAGYQAGNPATSGFDNTANGAGALQSDTSGYDNEANGYGALQQNTIGYENTANGYGALHSNGNGSQNTANGLGALQNNSSGSENTANGVFALVNNGNGSDNTANGAAALYGNGSGSFNTANGVQALSTSATGNYNTVNGAFALSLGRYLTANTVDGAFALENLGEDNSSGGTNNIAIGYGAGMAYMDIESSNIVIGNIGVQGENQVIRIGDHQTVAYIAGVITGNGSGLTDLNASQLTSGTINNSQLANSSITVNTGPGLSGSGSPVALGGTITLNNTGVTSLIGGDGVTVSAATGDLTLGLGSTLTLPSLPVSIIAGNSSLLYADNNGNYFAGHQAGNPAMTGTGNTANGAYALMSNTSGSANTASGLNALLDNSSGAANTADGAYALVSNQTGSDNSANGAYALAGNASGNYNTANGAYALSENMTGNGNTANGNSALQGNVTGSYNVGDGSGALGTSEKGSYNTALGYNTLSQLGVNPPFGGGSNNIAVGFMAGANFGANESSNIDIGNVGVAGENQVIRIGDHQTVAYISGIITGNGSGLTSLNGSQITGGTINNSQLANSSITVNTGPGLSAVGSPVALGGTIMLNNTGVTSLTGGGGVTVSASSGAVTLGSTATSVNTPNTIVSRDGTGSFSAQNLTLAGILNLPAPPVTINSGPRSLLLGDYLNDLFVGFSAGNLTSSGGDNTGLGYESLQAVTSGNQNVAVGSHSLAAETTGMGNVAVGYLALQQNTSGFLNTACGWESLAANTGGWYDTAIGPWALQANTTGDNNTAVGYDALGGNTTGTENTAYGVHANLYNTTGSNNVAVGWWSLNYCAGGSGNIALGYQAGINLSGSESENIDIGNAGKPGDYGVTRIGTPGIQSTTSLAGICNSHVGYGCLAGTAGTVFGNTFNFWWTNSQLQAWVDNVDVGVVSFLSDRRLKEKIQPLTDDAVTRVMALRPSTFKYKDVPGTIFHGDSQTKEGFIADELQQVIPSAVNGQTNAVTSKGTIQPQSVNLMPVVAVLTKAVQEQQQEIDELKAEIKALSGRQ